MGKKENTMNNMYMYVCVCVCVYTKFGSDIRTSDDFNPPKLGEGPVISTEY
jgi:hypothetical protein